MQEKEETGTSVQETEKEPVTYSGKKEKKKVMPPSRKQRRHWARRTNTSRKCTWIPPEFRKVRSMIVAMSHPAYRRKVEALSTYTVPELKEMAIEAEERISKKHGLKRKNLIKEIKKMRKPELVLWMI